MVRILTTSLALWLAMTLGCEKSAQPPQTGSTQTAQKDQHGHDAGAHEGHQHGAEEGAHEHHAGERHELGTAKIGAFEVSAAYSGTISAGKPVDIDLGLKGQQDTVTAVRAWIGTEDAKGSVKARATLEGQGYHAEVEAPEPLPAHTSLWIEIETNQGQTLVGSLALQP